MYGGVHGQGGGGGRRLAKTSADFSERFAATLAFRVRFRLPRLYDSNCFLLASTAHGDESRCLLCVLLDSESSDKDALILRRKFYFH